MNFGIGLSIFTNNIVGILIGVPLDLLFNLERIVTLMILSLSVYENFFIYSDLLLCPSINFVIFSQRFLCTFYYIYS